MKVVINIEEERNRILSNLRYLKDIPEYKTISVNEDYTITERRMIKDWSDKANEKNKNESPDSKFVGRVQGSPKNGLRLKRFLKPAQATDCNQVMVKKYSSSYQITKKQITIKIIRNHLAGAVYYILRQNLCLL